MSDNKTAGNSCGFLANPPDHVVAGILLLLILEVLQHARLDPDRKIIGFETAYGNKAGRHLPAMQVARHGTVYCGQLFGVEVVTAAQGKFPFIGKREVAVETQVMHQPHVVFQSFFVEARAGITQSITQADIPGHFEG